MRRFRPPVYLGSRIEGKRKIGKRKKGKRKKGKRKNGKPKCSRKKGKRKIGKLQTCLINVKCTAPRQWVAVSVRNTEVGYFCCQSPLYQIAYADNNKGVSMGPTQGPYIFTRSLHITTLHGSLILLRGHPSRPTPYFAHWWSPWSSRFALYAGVAQKVVD